jgi:hypothetical protein
MVRIGTLFLGLIFSGGAILAAGTVLGPVKRSISRPPADRSPRRTASRSDAEENASRLDQRASADG